MTTNLVNLSRLSVDALKKELSPRGQPVRLCDYDNGDIVDELESRGYYISDVDPDEVTSEDTDLDYISTTYLISSIAIRLHGRGTISRQDMKDLICDYIDNNMIPQTI